MEPLSRFKNQQTERVVLGVPVRRLPADIQRRARMRLQRVVTAGALYDLDVARSAIDVNAIEPLVAAG